MEDLLSSITPTEDAPTTLSDQAPPDPPTGLKSVLDVIPAHCYQRSALRGTGLVVRDLAVYGLALWALSSTNNVLLLVPLWLVAGLAVAGLFVLGHDAAHGALFDSTRANALIARLTMLPSLHATEVWIYGHNRVHHGHTLKQGLDFVWHPLTPDQYRDLGPVARMVHRLEWGPVGAGAYYVHNIWWNKMIRFSPPRRWRHSMRRDQALVAAVALGSLTAILVITGLDGLWLWTKLVVIPFLVFCQIIGWVVYVHHIAPEIQWWPRHEWNRFRGQVEGTTVLWGPPGWDLFFHSIMVHLPHHVDMRIPCYRLKEAALAIAAAFPGDVDQRPIRLRDYRRSVRECKIYDFDAGSWIAYPTTHRSR
ncbi:MAG: fatty acid desaturase [Acidimicrobiales bacterium]